MDWYENSQEKNFLIAPNGTLVEAKDGHNRAVFENPSLFNVYRQIDENQAREHAIWNGAIACKIMNGILAVHGQRRSIQTHLTIIMNLFDRYSARRIVDDLDPNFVLYKKEEFEEKYS